MHGGDDSGTERAPENVCADIPELDKFLSWIKNQRRYSKHTLDNYARSVRGWALWLSENEFFDGDIKKAKRILARNYVASFSGKAAKTTIHNKISALRTYYRFMQQNSLAQNNPFEALKLPKLEKNLPVFLNTAQVPQLLATPVSAANENQGAQPDEKKASVRDALCDSLCLELLYGAGLRVSELCSLKWENMDMTLGTARVLGKGGKTRFCPIGKPALELLKKWREDFCKGVAQKYFILHPKGGTPMYPRRVQRRLREYLLKAGLPVNITPHKLRHSYATHLMNAGMDLRMLQELMGHASLSSTQIYTHLNMKQLKEIYSSAHPRARK